MADKLLLNSSHILIYVKRVIVSIIESVYQIRWNYVSVLCGPSSLIIVLIVPVRLIISIIPDSQVLQFLLLVAKVRTTRKYSLMSAESLKIVVQKFLQPPSFI